MNKNQLSENGVYEYKENKDSKNIFVTVCQHGFEIFVYFPNGNKRRVSDIPNTATFSKWI